MSKLKSGLKELTEALLMAGIGAVIALTVYGGVKNSLDSSPVKKINNLASVTITRMDGRSGGSGVVLSSSNNSSTILTNAHVCEVAENGGIVKSDLNQGIVVNYRMSEYHDLCLITTNVDMRVNTAISESAPNLYDDATVVGHPQLLPTVVQRGMFSHKKVITLLAGIKKCTKAEWENDKLAPLCFFLGGIPNIIQREAQVISAFISPGSSGSPVFNNDGEVAGLVFAGRGEISYGLIVPLEYINEFMNNELKTLKTQVPNNEISESLDGERRLKTACSNTKSEEYEIVKDYCDFVMDGLY